MPTLAFIKEFLASMVGPWIFLSYVVSHIPQTVRRLVATRQWRSLFWPGNFKYELFNEFWAWWSPQIKPQGEPKRILPLLGGRVTGGKVTKAGLVVGTPISGTVIEVGAGSGLWADTLAKFVDLTASSGESEGLRKRVGGPRITKVYGVEPSPSSAAALRKHVQEIGLGDVYEVIPLGIEELGTGSAPVIEPGSVDCIVSVLALCSIPNQEHNVRELYKLLKPGGRWYVYEHVKMQKGGIVLSLYQRMINVVWSMLMGSCRICKPTEQSLRNAGPWSHIDLAKPVDEPPYQLLPHVFGTLTK